MKRTFLGNLIINADLKRLFVPEKCFIMNPL